MSDLDPEDKQKLKELFTKYEHYLLRIAESYVGQSSCAEDLVLETFIRAIPHLKELNLEEGHKARNYLVTIIEHLAIDFLRTKKLFPLKERMLNDFIFIDEDLKKVEDQLLIQEAMKNLSLQDEQILRLRYLQDMSNQEIAELLSIKESTVRKRLERARKRLRKIVEDLS